MKEEFNGEIIEYDFYGFENAQAAEEMKKGKNRKAYRDRKFNDTYS